MCLVTDAQDTIVGCPGLKLKLSDSCFLSALVRMQRFGLGCRLWDTDKLLLLLKVTFPALFAKSQKGLVTMTDF